MTPEFERGWNAAIEAAASHLLRALESGRVISAEIRAMSRPSVLTGDGWQPIETAPLDTPLPCDIEIGAVHFGKGVKLSTFIEAARRWYGLAAQHFPGKLGDFPAPPKGEEG